VGSFKMCTLHLPLLMCINQDWQEEHIYIKKRELQFEFWLVNLCGKDDSGVLGIDGKRLLSGYYWNMKRFVSDWSVPGWLL